MSLKVKPFKAWIRLYALAAGKDASAIEKKLSPTEGRFHQRLFALRNSNGFDSEDLTAMIYYAFLHNPLGIPVSEYGKLDNLAASVVSFSKFCQYRVDDIKEHGLLSVVVSTAPVTTKTLFDSEIGDSVKRYL